jgi:hypothetical protein
MDVSHYAGSQAPASCPAKLELRLPNSQAGETVKVFISISYLKDNHEEHEGHEVLMH